MTSTPPGATIRRAGVEVGQTPAFVDVKRTRPGDLTLAARDGAVPLHLKRHYRWRGSFWPNLVFLWAAPIGWAVDLLTGTAFELEPAPPPDVALTREDAAHVRRGPPVVAVAPARSDEPSLSDAAGAAIEAHLRARGRRVRPYRETLPAFLHEGFDFDGAPPVAARAGLYQSLAADAVVESTVKVRGERLVLETRERAVFGDRVRDGDTFTLDAPSGTDRAFVSPRWWSRLLPNSVAIDLAPTKTSVNYGGEKFPIHPPPDASFTTKVLDSLTSIKITSLPARRLERDATWSLSLVPTIRASRRRVTVPGLPTTVDSDENTMYTRWLVGAGYGPEFGVQSGQHYVYLNTLPLLLYSQVETRGLTAGALGLQVSVEIGYLYYLNPRWNLRLFSRSQNENDEIWRKALRPRLFDEGSVSVTNLVAGVSVGYRFEPHARFTRVR